MQTRNKLINMLGLAKRAGKLSGGETAVLEAIRSGKAELVLIATDASDNTKKMFNDKCTYYGVPVYECISKNDFGHASLVISDRNFSDAIRKLL